MFSYRTRRFLGRLLRFLGILILIALAVAACWLLWLQRFLIYTSDGVKLDFSLPQSWGPGVEAKPLGTLPSVDIQYGDLALPTDPNLEPELRQISGFYVTTQELMADLDGVLETIQDLEPGSAVLLEVKDGWGDFFYSTSVGLGTANAFDIPRMDAFFETVNSLGLHTIARVSALRDYAFGLAYTDCGLWHPGGYLWIDDEHCYWLDPTKDGTMTYLIRITQELQALGFDEVVFRDFYIPQAEDLLFEGDRSAALTEAAGKLVNTCASGSFAVSFMAEDGGLRLPETNCRLYLENVAAEEVAELGERLGIADPQRQLLFLTDSGDTRYEACCVLRPIDMAY